MNSSFSKIDLCLAVFLFFFYHLCLPRYSDSERPLCFVNVSLFFTLNFSVIVQAVFTQCPSVANMCSFGFDRCPLNINEEQNPKFRHFPYHVLQKALPLHNVKNCCKSETNKLQILVNVYSDKYDAAAFTGLT